MLTGAIDSSCPASVLQLHPCCEFLLDAKAASDIDIDLLRK